MENQKMMFFNFSQNNSGGYYINNDKLGICEEIIIEAENAKQAEKIFDSIGSKLDEFDEFCECCGERWYPFNNDENGTKEPQIYNKPIREVKSGPFRKSCFIHYLDGKILKHKFI